MKKIHKIALLISFVFLFTFMLSAKVDNILPKPQHISFTKCGNFSLNQPIQLILPDIGETDPGVGEELIGLVNEHEGEIVSHSEKKISVELINSIQGAEFQDEAYSLAICESGITINAVTLRGAYWAVQTLWQIAEGNNYEIPSCQIIDWAAFKIRGYMHDIGRSFIEFDELKNEISKLSRYKINVFHWHLTDNQGWRLESKIYPQLNANSSYSRFPGKFYTIEQAKELVHYAIKHGITVIPEIDMPGHSEAFRKAMGHVMLTNEGLSEMKNIMTEACQTFADTEWMHIGSDEVRQPDTQGSTMTVENFISQLTSHIKTQGKKIVVWNPGHGYNASQIDMTQMWSSRGTATNGIPAIDSRYHYINHYDQFADVVSLYNSTIAGQEKGSAQYAGTIIGIWNDRALPSDKDIVLQNAFYQSMLAIAERAWLGGGKGYFTEIGTNLDPTNFEFMDWERRFLTHKANFLKNEPIAYVKQSNIKWNITDQFPNDGNTSKTFPPETQLSDNYIYNGETYKTSSAFGAGIYLRHVWGTLIPAFYNNPLPNHTAYAYTYVYSPTAKTVGVQIEFQNYGRSEADLPPKQGEWDYNGSKVFINDVEIAAPVWENTHTNKSNEITLKNENFTARNPIPVSLEAGWNKVLIKLPNKGFSLNAVRLVKWMFTFVFVTPDGNEAVKDLIYSPDKNIKPNLDILLSVIDKSTAFIDNVRIGEEPGYYSYDRVNNFIKKVEIAKSISKTSGLSDNEYKAAAQELILNLERLKKQINLPKISNETTQYWYSLSTPQRINSGNNFITFKGNNTPLKGESYVTGNENQLWKFTQNEDGTLNIIPKSSESHIDSNSPQNTALKAQAGVISNGWNTTPIYSNPYFIITSGDVQLNQTTSGLNNIIYNWGGGSNTTDAGCIYQIRTEEVTGATLHDELSSAINNAYGTTLSIHIGEQPGEYSQQHVDEFIKEIDKAKVILNNTSATDNELQIAINELKQQTSNFKQTINYPLVSSSNITYWYKLTSERENRSVSYQGDNNSLIGKKYVNDEDSFLWKLVALQDGTFSLVNKVSGSFISSTSPKLTAKSGELSMDGWSFTPLFKNKQFIITSGTSQFNQGNGGTQYAINNWGDGTNTTDTGCRYIITLIKSITSNDSKILSDEIRVWIDDNYIKSNIPIDDLSIYSIDGKKLNPRRRLSNGVVFVKTPNSIKKILIH